VQTTLLGLAIATIVALVTALIGPLFVDWSQYRTDFEREATRFVGLPVRVTGAIDVRLLPTPSLVLNGVEIGRDGDNKVRARALAIEFALSALVRGRLRSAQTRIVAPELILSLDRDGRVALPRANVGFDPQALSIDRLVIEDGRVTLEDTRNESRVVLEKLWFNGDARSLAGTLRGEGAFLWRRELYGFRLASTREEGGLKVRFGVDPSDSPFSTEAEGLLSFDGSAPRYEGSLTLARAAGAVLAGGRPLMSEPIRIVTRVKATPASALFEQIDFQYGPEERALKLTGTAQFRFGARPQLDGVLSARQLDIDRLTASADIPRRNPAAALVAVAESFGVGFQAPVPLRIGIGIDTVMLSGLPVQGVRGDLASEGDGWVLDGVSFRAPGLSDLRLSGRLNRTSGFNGPVELASADPRALSVWLTGRSDLRIAAGKPLRVRGDVTIGNERVAIEGMRADFDRSEFSGRLAYAFATPNRKARLDCELHAPELDLDALSDLANAALAPGLRLEPPGEVTLALQIGKARIAGLEARALAARIKSENKLLHVERMSVGDIEGLKLDVSGRMDTGSALPRGDIVADLDARDLSPLVALSAKFVPDYTERVRLLAERLRAAKLKMTLGIEGGDASPGATRLVVEGIAGNVGIKLRGEARANPADLARSDVNIDVALDSADGAALLRLIGLDALAGPTKGQAQLRFAAKGPINEPVAFQADLSGPVQASASGRLRPSLDKPDGTFDLTLRMIDAGLLRPATRAEPLALALAAHVTVSAGAVTFDRISGSVGDAPVRGQLQLSADRRLSGNLETDFVDAPSFLAAAIGLPPGERGDTEPLGKGFQSAIPGRIAFRVPRARLGPGLVANGMRGMLRIGPSDFTLENVESELAAGRLAGGLSFRRSEDGLATKVQLALRDAEAERVVPGGAVSGRMTVQVDAEGNGRTLKAVLGSFSGNGLVTLERSEIKGLSATAFEAAMKTADQGAKLEGDAIRASVATALSSGRLKIPHAEAALSIAAGQLRLGTMVAGAEGAQLAASGSLTLADLVLDGRIVLASAGNVTSAGRPEITVGLRGPVTAPKRSLDIAVLTGWLALRAVEQQSKKLEAIEKGSLRVEPPVQPTPQEAAPPLPREQGVDASAPQRAPDLPPPVEIAPAPRSAAPARPRNILPPAANRSLLEGLFGR
jgi:uncharacterized protein involved in outer membrane biogenesis